MTIVMEIERPEDVRVKLSCTMTVAQWQLISDAFDPEKLDRNVWDFRDAIRLSLERARVRVDNQAVIKDQ